MLAIRDGIHKMLVGKTKREDPDQTASKKAVRSGSVLFLFEILEHLPYRTNMTI